MRKTPRGLAWLSVVVLMGCIPSLHPLYTEKDLVFDESLLGEWTLDDGKG